MRKRISMIRRNVILAIIGQILLVGAAGMFLKMEVLLPALIIVMEGVMAVLLFDRFESITEESSSGVRGILGTAAVEAYQLGGIGMLIYDDSYEVTWMSELFRLRSIDKVGERLLTWIPEADDLVSGKTDRVRVQLDDRIYEITRKEDAPMLFFKDVTELYNLSKAYVEEKTVLGIASFDNYEESTQYEDDADAAAISAAVRTPLIEYCTAHHILARRMGESRYLLLCNEKELNELIADRFSILAKVRKAASRMDVSISLSLALAHGTTDFNELDDMAQNLLDLAETRGGDQVAMQKAGEDVKYFGGSSEAAEKRSRVRVRVMAHALKDLIERSSNVIIAGHKMADFDCIGSAIGLARVAQALNKEAFVIATTGGIEEKLKAAMELHKEKLKKEVRLVSESEALNHLNSNTLVIMTDHHSLRQSNGARVLEGAKKIAVVDHHRRSTDMGVKPVLVYIEAGASSTCELVTEMIPYLSNRVDLSEVDGDLMLTGMIVDTQNFRVRTGSRTYEAASALREYGADPQRCYGYLKDTFEEFTLKTSVATRAQKLDHGVVIAPVTDKGMTRSLMSQVADSLLGIQGVEAAFVIAKDDSGTTCISARSAGRINVQIICEKMGGGGHMTAAAMQRAKTNIQDVREELIQTLEQYWKEENDNESDTEE